MIKVSPRTVWAVGFFTYVPPVAAGDVEEPILDVFENRLVRDMRPMHAHLARLGRV